MRGYRNHDKEFKPFEKILNYNNEQLREEILPLFERMLDIFTENFWLAFVSTKQYYSEVFNFVEIWKRNIVSPLPSDVIKELQHTQQKLDPFFTDVIEKLVKLEKFLSGDLSYRQLK